MREAFTHEAQGIRFTFLTAQALNEPTATEHEALGFFRPHELAGLCFCPADVAAARLLCVGAVKHFMWDFDGTLMDTYGQLTQSVVLTARAFGHEEPPERVLSLLKVTLPHCIRVLSAEYGVEPEEFRRVYQPIDAAADLTLVPPVPGIPEVLRALKERGARHYIVTHRSRATCEAMLENHGLLPLFDGMVTQEDPLPRKPDPARCRAILERYGIAPEEAMMLGDRPIDITAGLGAGVLTLLLDRDGRFPDSDAHFRVADIRKLLEP